MREGMKRGVARVVLVAFLSLTLFTCGGGGGGGGGALPAAALGPRMRLRQRFPPPVPPTARPA